MKENYVVEIEIDGHLVEMDFADAIRLIATAYQAPDLLEARKESGE